VALTIRTPEEQTIAHFRDHGWMRVPQAFDADTAAAMRDAVWDALAGLGVRRDQPSTWTADRPAHLQRLKNDPVFRAVGGRPLRAAIDAVLEGRPYEPPENWGAFFIAFPSDAEWGVPTSGWHADANYLSPLWPTGGVKTHALFGDIAPRGGGTQIVSGSHRLVRKWFEDNPPPPGARGAELRKRLQAHPYIRDLHTQGDRDARIARFVERAEEVDGVPLRVIENTGDAGDILLLHPLVLHVAAPNTSAEPRFLLSGGVTTDMWGWGT
jgi:hypothetical protein